MFMLPGSGSSAPPRPAGSQRWVDWAAGRFRAYPAREVYSRMSELSITCWAVTTGRRGGGRAGQNAGACPAVWPA